MPAKQRLPEIMCEDDSAEAVDLLDDAQKEDLAEPPRYQVVFINDDYTTMDFVIEVLVRRFHHDGPTAVDIMLTVHETGSAVAGLYTRDVAETLAEVTMADARAAGHPLRVTSIPAD